MLVCMAIKLKICLTLTGNGVQLVTAPPIKNVSALTSSRQQARHDHTPLKSQIKVIFDNVANPRRRYIFMSAFHGDLAGAVSYCLSA
jgi:hypothetical protein